MVSFVRRVPLSPVVFLCSPSVALSAAPGCLTPTNDPVALLTLIIFSARMTLPPNSPSVNFPIHLTLNHTSEKPFWSPSQKQSLPSTPRLTPGLPECVWICTHQWIRSALESRYLLMRWPLPSCTPREVQAHLGDTEGSVLGHCEYHSKVSRSLFAGEGSSLQFVFKNKKKIYEVR